MSQRQRRRQGKRRRHQEPTSSKRKVALGAGLTIGATLAAGGSAQAAVFTVDNLGDTSGDVCSDVVANDCSLREAIVAANGNPNSTLGENDEITFDATLSGTLELTSDLPTITDGVYIFGPPSGAVTIDGADTFHIFQLDISTSYNGVEIGDLTLANGSAPFSGGAVTNVDAIGGLFNMTISSSQAGDGGAIFNGGDLFVDESILTGNEASGQGGAIFNNGGDLEVDESLIVDNHADEGGGIYSLIGDLQIVDSTISGNEGTTTGGGVQTYSTYAEIRYSTLVGNYTDGNGGGIEVQGYDTFDIRQATISGNDAGTRGAGIHDDQAPATNEYYRLDLDDVTIANNYATLSAGGIAEDTNDTYEPFIGNSIIADNTVGLAGNDPDVSGTLDVSFSVVEDPGSATLTGSDVLYVDPQLQPLADNGGPTMTHAPLITSPVVDRGGSNVLDDQRHEARKVDLPTIPNGGNAAQGVDIGAVELQSLTDSQPVPPADGAGAGAGTGAGAPTCKGKTATIFARPGLARTFNGTSKKDVIVGTTKKDTIRAKGGNDLVCAKGGKDTVKGGGGKDKLYGQGGKDKLFGQGGKDLLSGGGKNDTCVGGAGRDTEKSC